MGDLESISALATAGGTLVLAVATFSAVRSSNRSARIAEQALRTSLRPLLVQSLGGDPTHKVLWADRHHAQLPGGRAVAEREGDVLYLAIALRNVGTGLALLHGWAPHPDRTTGETGPPARESFRRLTIDLYIPAGAGGYWEGALRDPGDPLHAAMAEAVAQRRAFTIDLLYGDQDGGQRTISRCTVMPAADDGWFVQVPRHWQVDRPDPR